MNVTRNVMLEPRLTPGGGAVEMALSRFIHHSSFKSFIIHFLL
jgi:chaperonin GroEL (HSP60 family)